MSRNERLVLAIYAGLSFSYAVSSVFVNMFLYRYLDGTADLAAYNLYLFGLMPFGFYAGGKLALALGEKATLVVGLGLFIAFYGILVLLGEASASYLYLLGGVNGLANGFFWFSFNAILTDVSDRPDSGRFFGAYGVTGAVAGAAAPAASALLLKLAPNLETGYGVLFAVILAVSAGMAAAAAALSLPPRRVPFRVADKVLPGRDPLWRYALWINLAFGVRDGANWSVFSVLVLKAAGGDVLAGSLAVVFAAAGAAANAVGGRLLNERNGAAFWAAGSALAVAAAVLLVAVPTPAAAAVAGSAVRIAEAVVFLPFNVALFAVFAEFRRREGSIAGRNIVVEAYLNLGRGLGVGAFLVASRFVPFYAEILFPLVSLALPLCSWIYLRHRPLDRIKELHRA